MKGLVRNLLLLCAGSLVLTACASSPDHFYTLQALPAPTSGEHPPFVAVVSVHVSVPSLIDRNQLVLSTVAGSVQVVEHERWASPLGDQLATVLGQDLEQRRPDVIVTPRAGAQSAGLPHYAIQADVVTLGLRRAAEVQMEVRWRVDRPGASEIIGRELLSATPDDASAAALGRGISQCIATLADRLAPTLRAP